ncbi:MAG TPA: sulfatase/phosphatase domain-containing protein, partial [Actinomycetota bacterium]|nr:sulfatase/phosphatase domain-containing protein [Actinomycetota bacterium]
RGLTDHTWAVYASDHGRLWGEHGLARKLFAYEESIRFPLLLWAPGFPRTTIDQIVANVDVVPTLTALALDLEDHRYDGRSLLPLLAGDAADWRDALLIQNWATYRYDAVRTPRYTYVHWPRTGHEELYDLRRDPYELQSVAATRPAELERMRALLGRLLH